MSVSVTWNELAMFGVLASFLLSVLIYMLSYLISSELLRAWARHEIQSVFITLILFASLMSLAQEPFITEYRNSGLEYLKNLYFDGVYCQFSMISGMNALALLSSVTLSINPTIFNLKGSVNQANEPKSSAEQSEKSKGREGQAQAGDRSAVTAGISFGPVLQPLMSAFSDLQGLIFIPFTFLQFHIQLLEIIGNKGITLLLPLGIFLRAFKFTRHGGNLLIALFIALYFILPAMYLFNKGLMQERFGLGNDMKICEKSKPKLIAEFAGPVMKEAGFSEVAGIGGDGGLSKAILSEAEKLTYKAGSDFATLFLRVGAESTILPMLAIIISLGLAREFALLLGSDVDFSQLIRVV
ncbi:MAG: hypothetical protein N3G76_02670 [Candidatus Micrarchaeota archaeon]|nr:hypothetical protein [Candidatus Micrarchaeota archaeon]